MYWQSVSLTSSNLYLLAFLYIENNKINPNAITKAIYFVIYLSVKKSQLTYWYNDLMIINAQDIFCCANWDLIEELGAIQKPIW